VKSPRCGLFFLAEPVTCLRMSRGGFEGFGVQAEPRPAGCRRIPRSPPVSEKPALRAFLFGGASDMPVSAKIKSEAVEIRRVFRTLSDWPGQQ
jgi:hypothetical protein